MFDVILLPTSFRVCGSHASHLIHQGYSESLANGISMVIKYDRKEMVVLYDFSRRREGEGARLISLLFLIFYQSINFYTY